MTQRPRLSGPDTATRPVRPAAVPDALSHLPPPHEYLRAARPFHFPPSTRALPARSVRVRHLLSSRTSDPLARARPPVRWTPAGRQAGVPASGPEPAAAPPLCQKRSGPRRAARVHRCTTLPPANPLKASRHFASPAPPLGEAHQILARPLLPSRAARTHATQGGKRSSRATELIRPVPSPWREPSARPPRCRSRARGPPPPP